MCKKDVTSISLFDSLINNLDLFLNLEKKIFVQYVLNLDEYIILSSLYFLINISFSLISISSLIFFFLKYGFNKQIISRYSAPRKIETGQAPCDIRSIENKELQLTNNTPKIKNINIEQL